MKICYIGDADAIHTQRWVNWFARRHEVIVISTRSDAELPEYKVAELPADMPRGLVTRSRLMRSAWVVRKVLATHRPDILHCHYINEAGWFGLASAWRPLVVTAWGSDVYRAPSESRLARLLNPLTVRRADHVTCDSRHQADVMRSWGVPRERLSVIGWGVDRSEFHQGVDGQPLRGELGIPTDAPVVLSPRQWYANSNIPSVVAAHTLLPEDTYLILKRLPGFEPDNSASVKAAIASSPARDRIRTIGRIEPQRLPSLYAASDVVVSLCTTDGTPASVLEAMAVGRPVVALRNESLAEWIAQPGGQLVDTLEPARIARALGHYLTDPVARDRAAAYNADVARRRADREVEFERMDEIYQRLHALSRGHRVR